MNLRRLLFILFALGSLLTAGSAFIGAPPAQAQVNTGLAEVGQTVKLPSTDPRIIAVNIINIALGVIGIILVALILYAGFLWMTSAGEADKVEKAKKIIINAVIGLVIILSAWAITRFVIERLLQATQEGGGVGGTGTGYSGGFGGGTGTSFRVKSITPQGDSPLKPRNVEVKIVFTKPVDENSAGAIVVIKEGGTTVGGSLQVDGSLVTFTPTQACPTPNETRKCFDSNSTFLIKVGNTVKSTGGQSLTCGGFAPSCEAKFSTSDLVDTQPPTVSVTYPTDGMPVKENSLFDVLASAADDSGVSTVEFFDGASSFAIDGPNSSNTPMSFGAKGVWDTSGAARGPHSLSATAFDLDTNSTKSASVSVMVRAEHCFDDQINGGETGLNCGGDPNSPEYCGACTGGACTSGSQCASGFCQNGVCVEKPVIKYISPLNGKAGTFVSIAGFNFGTSTGVVKFLGNPNNSADDKVAVAPQACTNAGTKTWSNTQVVVATPDGAASGPIEITNAASGLSDRTDQDPGPAIQSYVVDNSEHPGLCAIVPAAETVGKEVDAIGAGLGQTAGFIIFGAEDYQLQASPWSDAKAHFKIPVVNNGSYQVWAKTAAGLSNSVEFSVLEQNLGEAPQLSSIDPSTGPQQEYVTLSGKNFGYSVGTVIFTGQTANGPMDAIGDTSFPAACASGFWRDDTIVVKVPSVFKNGTATTDGVYQVRVKPPRPDNKESNSLDFTLDSKLTPKPGVCAIQPAIGPEGTVVQLFGDRFGYDKPIVTFNPSKNSLVDSSNNQEIKTAVPKNAATGPVTVLAQNAKSNAVNFQVRNCNEAPEICGPADKFQCCPSGECRASNEACGVVSTKAEFAWQMSTGLIPLAPYVVEECRPDLSPAPIPSPSPWLNRAGGDQAPVDAQIMMRFSQKLEDTSVKPSAFKLYACTGTGDDPCVTKTEVLAAMSYIPGVQQDVVTLKPNDKLAVKTTYLVTVSTLIKGAGVTGAFMLERQDCGVGPNNTKLGYCFRFKTRDSTEPSQIGAVGVVPPLYRFSETGVNTRYEAAPESLNDKCIIINCKLFNWDWKASDGRGEITNNKENGYGLCNQLGQGKSETGDVPVDITASLVGSTLQGLGLMYVNFIPPQVVEYAPNCDAACTNALVWARFSSKLDLNSVTDPANIIIKKCLNENCYESDVANIPPIKPTGIKLVDETTIEISHDNFEPGAFYTVLLRGGPNVIDSQTKENIGIKGKYGIPMAGTNHPMGFSWKFRVNVGQDAFCKAERVDVKPLEKFELNVDGRQLFTATPVSKPDACSANGQKLVASGSVVWNITQPPLVADLYKIGGVKLVATDPGKLPVGCSGSCLATGSGGLYGKLAICGNDKIETTDSNFCKVPISQTVWPKKGTTPKGDDCYLLPPAAKGGEECEPNVDGLDLCDPNSCLFKPVKLLTAGGTCGDGHVVVGLGEACDFGTTCVGGSASTSTPAVPEYTPCGDTPQALAGGVTKQACENAGGICSMFDYRGCSAGCRHLGAQAGKTTCGNSDLAGDGKDCDDGNKTDGDGCSSNCLHEGSKPKTLVAAMCGDMVLQPGETCEATSPGVFPPGCDSMKCVHTGVLACAQGETQKCCGNGVMDSGEDCDDGNKNPDDGCSQSCLFEGSSAYYWSQGHMAPSFCGDGVLEQGEQCEITDSASSDKVAALINYPAAYAANPPKTGVAALAPVLNKPFAAAPTQIDETQLAFIVGLQDPDPETGRSSSTISATMMDQTGRATYGLQCGYTEESFCLPDAQNQPRGLDKFGCCRVRPYTINSFPTTPPKDVCRNVQISAEFNDKMDSGSVVNNFQLAQEPDAQNKCPAGTSDLIVKNDAPVKGFWNKVKAWWSGLIAWFTGAPSAQAEKWCLGGITGQLRPIGDAKEPTKFAFTLDKVLPANTWFRVIFKGDPNLGDNSDLNKREGIKTLNGVVYDANPSTGGDLSWKFKTNDKICALNVLTINDVTQLHDTPPPPEQPGQEHPYLFINPGNMPEYRQFEAVAQSIDGNQAIPLSSTDEYQWTWQPWTTSNQGLVYYSDKYPLPQGPTAEFRTQQEAGGASQRNGTAVLTAGLKVTKDTVNVPSTVSSTLFGAAPVTVLACENPWPSLQTAPFQDTDLWLKDKYPLVYGAQNVFTIPDPLVQNFSTLYCRDAGEAHNVDDDLPALRLNPVPRTQLDKDKGILRQYLFTFDKPELKQDGIGIRIMENPMHLSPQEWYAAQGFVGSPKAVTVDSYPALQDGPSIYVAAANQPKPNGPIYSNIYIISHNPNAAKTTLQIYDQLVSYLTFNINIQGQSNTCHYVEGTQYDASTVYMPPGKVGQLVLPIDCMADNQCVALEAGKNIYCDANKLKMARDTQRIADYQSISRKLAMTFGNQNVPYPQLTGGTFLKGTSVSLWSSWDELGKQIGLKMPVDPVNRFVTCGRCADNKLCQSDAECAGQTTTTCMGGSIVNGSWTANPDIDPETCWNSVKSQYVCPRFSNTNPFSASRLYQYRAFAGGTQYQVASEFEVQPLMPNKEDWWSPPLSEFMYRCFSTSTYGQICTGSNGQANDKLCRKCTNPANCKQCKQSGLDCTSDATICKAPDICQDVPVISGSCRPVGGSFKYANVCTNLAYAENGVCGDGVKNTASKICSISYKACAVNADCGAGGGVCMGEFCELGETASYKCATDSTKPNVLDGHKLYSCVACTHFDVDPKHPQCIPDVKCGNGRIDKHCVSNPAQGCLTDSDCGTGQCVNAEQCDDGALNGSYGHCAVGCAGYGGFCGNGQLDAGEKCDKGVANGNWSNQLDPNSCGLDCLGIGAYCGDQVIQPPNEECDGQTETSQKAICQGSSGKGILCDSDADCPQGVKCGSDITLASAGMHPGKKSLWGWLTEVLGPKAALAAPPPPLQTQTKLNIFVNPYWNLKFGGSNTLQKQALQVVPLQQGGSQQNQGTILEYVNAQGQKVNAGQYADCSKLFVEEVGGGKRPTQHVRNCNAPGLATACKWGTWSECVPVGVCGDGIKEPNEECDDGADNGDSKACTAQCKKNVCGDGKLNTGVEECDNGSQNGQPTCNADYNSSCLSCSLSCKFMASAGGYCGDGIKNGPEQCDGTDGLKDSSNVAYTCAKLGFDYGGCVNGTCTNKPTCDSACSFGDCKRCSDEKGDGEVKARIYDAVFQRVVPNARVTLMYKGVKVDETFSDGDGVFTFKSLNKNGACINYKLVVDMYDDNPCTNKDNGLEAGIPSTCYEGFTPPYTYPYSIDEGKNGGYFPFTSDSFSYNNFANTTNGVDSDGVQHIDILPRPERGKAYVAVIWKPQANSISFKLHTIVPSAMAFTLNDWATGEKSQACDYASGPAGYAGKNGTYPTVCIRDINQRAVGDWDIQTLPYSRLICLHRVGEKSSVWSDGRYNGCPVEGFVQCLKNQGKGKTPDSCRTTTNDADCTACGVDNYHRDTTNQSLASRGYTTCSDVPFFEDCMNNASFGPITNLINLAPMGSGGGTVKYMYTWGSGNAAATKDVTTSQTWKTRAYVAITNLAGSSEVQTVEKPTGSGWAWFIGEIDPKTFVFNKKNYLAFDDSIETTMTQGIPTSAKQGDMEGLGAWSFWFQGSGNGGYCIPNSITESKDSDPNTWLLNPNVGICIGGNTQLCAQQNSSCKTWSFKAYNKYVW